MGGLGNQLFQLAYAIKVKKTYEADKILIDITEFNKYNLREPEITKLDLTMYDVEVVNESYSLKYKIFTKIFYMVQGIYKRVFSKKLNFLMPLMSCFGFFFTDDAGCK